jgi:uncharacterized membrane protein YozB (DUF420 family)
LFRGIDGFLGTRASIMLDVVFVAMFAIVAAMIWAIQLAKRRHFTLHKQVQTALGITLLIAIVLFEVDMRFLTDWRERARPSPYYETFVFPSLIIHLCFAIPAAVLWAYVIIAAWRNFATPTRPGPYSARHMRWGKLAAFAMFMTSVTGWIFYWFAFVA